MSDTRAQGELTKQITLYQGKIGALGYLTQAQISQFDATQAQAAGMFKAGSAILAAGANAGLTAWGASVPTSSKTSQLVKTAASSPMMLTW